jgi:hypothetical protein
VASDGRYPAASIFGRDIRDSASEIPTVLPLVEASPAPAMFVATARPPGSQPSHCRATA